MQLVLMRGSPVSTAAVTKSAKAMPVMKRPRFSTCRIGSCPSFHSATRTRPESIPVSTPTKGMGSVRQKAPRHTRRLSPRGRRAGELHVVMTLLVGAALVDGGQGQVAGQGGSGRAPVDPGDLEGSESQGHVLRPLDVPSILGVHEGGGHACLVEGPEHRRLLLRPFVGVALPLRHQPGHGPAGHGARGLHQHLEIGAVREAPQDLPGVIARKGAKRAQSVNRLLYGHTSVSFPMRHR